MGKSLYYCGSTERKRQGMVSTFGLTNLNNFSRLWGVGAVPGCLALGPGLLGVRGDSGSE